MFRVFLLTVLSASLLSGVAACSRNEAHATGQVESAVARGEYLVKNVGMCADCHTPRNQDGSFDRKNWLYGSELAFTPTVPMPVWADVAPAIAGLPGYTEEEAVRLLQDGTLPDGSRLQPPMPEFRLNREDAEAVVAYLKSLEP